MMGTHKWHGSAPNDAQLLEALSQNPETVLRSVTVKKQTNYLQIFFFVSLLFIILI